MNAIESIPIDSHRILIIDDNSPDGTGEIADRISAEKPHVDVLHRPHKEGLGRAYIAGFHYALAKGADIIVMMDADLSHDPKYIPQMLSLINGYDVVLGVRYDGGGSIKNWGWFRRFLSAGANFLARKMLNLEIKDATTGFRCYSRRALEAIGIDNIFSEGYSFLVEMVYRSQKLGFSIGQVPIVFVNRTLGKSKISRREAIKGFITLLRLRFGKTKY